MAIYCITGKPRHGKTYFLIYNVSKWLKQGLRIYSNVFINLKSPFWNNYYKKYNLSADKILGDLDNPKDLENPEKQVFYWRHLRDWNKMSHGIVVADEGTRYFNPRKWNMLSEETEIKLQQHGKEELDIWITTQHFTRIDITLRVMVERFFKVEKLLGNGEGSKRIWGFFRLTEHYLEDMERAERAIAAGEPDVAAISREYYLYRRKYAELFNTRQMVGKSDAMELWHEERVCKTCGAKKITHT